MQIWCTYIRFMCACNERVMVYGILFKKKNWKPKDSSKWVENILNASDKISQDPEEMDDEV